LWKSNTSGILSGCLEKSCTASWNCTKATHRVQGQAHVLLNSMPACRFMSAASFATMPHPSSSK
jgi:hypothetical protein